MAERWRLADGMTLTHLENGGWTLADLHRLSIHELDEENGSLLDEALHSTEPTPISPISQDVVAGELGRVDAGDLAQVGLDRVGGGVGFGQ